MQPTVSSKNMYKIIYQDHQDPYSVLGIHKVKNNGNKAIAIRCFLPQTEYVYVITDNKEYSMTRLHEEGFYEIVFENSDNLFSYLLKIRYDNGNEQIIHDPYAFPLKGIGELDKHLLQKGSHYRSFDKLGAKLKKIDDISGVYFAVWAPNARMVSVIGSFNDWDRRCHMMKLRTDLGIWEIFIPGIGEGNPYKYQIVTQQGHIADKADPYGYYTELSPQTASVVYDIEKYEWHDQNWLKQREKNKIETQPINIYEVHLGSWKKKQDFSFLDYRTLAHELVDYVKEMGYTHIELLPVQEHPFYGSWGYQTIGYYAPTSRYGNPDDFMYFVDHCHQNGIGVILDWAPAHFPHDGHGLSYFDGTYLYEHADPRQREHKDWKTCIYNYGRHEVKNFLISNALFWAEKYHIDGFRVDAVVSMLYLDYSKNPGEWVPNKHGGRENLEAVDFIQELTQNIKKYHPGAIVIAEESTTWPGVTRPSYLGGLGFDYKWNMGWMNDILKYMGQDPIYRKFHHQTFSFSLWYAFSENFVLPLSHDEVVHGKRSLLDKMPGDLWQKFANLRLLLGYMYAHPGKKMLFMGGEFGQWREWSHDRELDWDLLAHEPHRLLHKYVRDLNWLYQNNQPLYTERNSFTWVDYHDADYSIIAFWRNSNQEHLLFIFNFTPLPRYNYRLGIQKKGQYTEIFNSDAEMYWGTNVGNMGKVNAIEHPWHEKPYHLNLSLPPLGMIVLKWTPTEEEKTEQEVEKKRVEPEEKQEQKTEEKNSTKHKKKKKKRK